MDAYSSEFSYQRNAITLKFREDFQLHVQVDCSRTKLIRDVGEYDTKFEGICAIRSRELKIIWERKYTKVALLMFGSTSIKMQFVRLMSFSDCVLEIVQPFSFPVNLLFYIFVGGAVEGLGGIQQGEEVGLLLGYSTAYDKI